MLTCSIQFQSKWFIPLKNIRILSIFIYLFIYFSFLIDIYLMEKIITNWQLNSVSFTNYNFVKTQ